MGLLLGGALTQYLSWRWCLYVNLIFAAVAFAGGALLLQRQPSPVKPRLDIPGVLLVSGALFCLVYGFSNAATHSWHAPSTWGFLAAGVALGVAFALWQGRAATRCCRPGWCSTATGAAPTCRCFRLGRAVRDLLVPDLLPAADARVLAAGDRCGVPAAQRRPHPRGQPVHDRADAQIRAQAAGGVRDAGRGRRDGMAGPAGPAHRLRREACSARPSWPESAWAW